jgi:hypothetical protein
MLPKTKLRRKSSLCQTGATTNLGCKAISDKTALNPAALRTTAIQSDVVSVFTMLQLSKSYPHVTGLAKF